MIQRSSTTAGSLPAGRTLWTSGLAVVGVVAMIAPCFAADDLVVAREGKALARIVVPPDPPGAVRFAAKELQHYLSRVSGAKFERTGQVPEKPPLIFVGNCEQAQQPGLDVSRLDRDGFYRAVIGGDLYLLGRDDPDRRWTRGGWGETAMQEHGTVTAVYDLLEDVCGVRWFMPGKFGELVPKRDTIAVPGGVIKEAPAFVERRIGRPVVFEKFADAEDVMGSPEA